MLLPVIMAGGVGSRLWPLSRHLNPKQFLALTGEQTMLQQTICRLNGLETEQPWLICNEEHRFLVAEQLRQLKMEAPRIFLEPEGRNTAPAIALAALQALNEKGDATLLVLAADHNISEKKAFHAAVLKALNWAQKGKLVTFGVVPHAIETGYGYIRQGISIDENVFTIQKFIEKPNLDEAKYYVESKEYFWNSGMFMFQASRYIEELRRFQPEIVEVCEQALKQSNIDIDFVRVSKDIFSSCPQNSIDYAVMEKTDAALMVPMNAGWSDIGSWSTLWDISPKNDEGNSLHGDTIVEDVHDTLIHAEHRLVSAVGVKNLIIVETKDAVLVGEKDKIQDVKKIVDRIKAEGRHEHFSHREIYRPWGVYDSIDNGPRYQVKRITVNPGAKLSVQMHYHRAEHWIVVSGTAKVTRGDDVFLISENQSTYIPIGEIHALENPGKIPLELIEVQSGSYLGEDDIVRFEDRYGRLS